MTANFSVLLGIPEIYAYVDRVEHEIRTLMDSSTNSLREPARRVLLGGKRLRPMLVIASAAIQDRAIDDQVIAAAAAVELVHLGTIVHDDVIDKADIRWGRPTVNALDGPDHAILVGDYLLALAGAQAATVSKEVAYTIAVTVAQMCDGQSRECADEFNADRTTKSYLEVSRKKTAALTSAACEIGGECAGLSRAHVEALAKYGEAFGMAFQLTDDIMDLVSTQEAMGKPVGNDLKEGVYTMPLLEALGAANGDEVRSWLGRRPVTKPTRMRVAEVLVTSGAIERTYTRIEAYNRAAVDALSVFNKNDVVSGLRDLPETYLKWGRQKATIL